MKTDKGFTLFVAIIAMSALLLVSTGLINIAVKQLQISGSSRESQFAFYAADSGMECALYWDIKNPTGVSAFATSTGTNITCNNSSVQTVGGNQSGVSVFTLNFTPDPYCATVTVTKNGNNTTKIESLGYNTCAASSRRVERAVRASY
jgi:Tfp pilus assembly protein PilX